VKIGRFGVVAQMGEATDSDKPTFASLKGEQSLETITLEEALYIIKRDTRHFAKRQLTWFRRERDVRWVNKSDFDSEEEILEYMLKQIEEYEE
jgi:tRNA A37 N6-isopentenylltransferase MiaA